MRGWVTVGLWAAACTAEPQGDLPGSAWADYADGEVRVRLDGAPEVGLSLLAYGSPGDLRTADAVAPTGDGARAAYVRDGLVEWWQATPAGLEQGFTLAPTGAPVLVLELGLDGASAVVDPDQRSATFVTGGGEDLRYEGLLAWDARGVELPARMEATADGLRLVVDAAGAVGEVTVDPVIPPVVIRREADQAAANYGYSVASAGDVNGDGYDDVLVGAYTWDGGQTDEGAAFLYLGSPNGPQVAPAWTAESDQTGANLGKSVASAGDVNGDGYDDVLVGADYYDGGQADEGRAFLFLGSAAGLSAAPAWTAESNQAGAYFGNAVASAGDVNGDGYDDVLAAAPFYDNGQANEGREFLFLGSAAGLAPAASWTAESNQSFVQIAGAPIGSAGDVNGDGYDDVVVGRPFYDQGQADEGTAAVFLGSAAGLAAAPAWVGQGNQVAAGFGSSVASAGDVNGDGFGDLVVGAFTYDGGQGNEGAAFLYLGSAAGLPAVASWQAESNQANALFGTAAGVGDVNADGFDDVVVGAPSWDAGTADEGAAFLYLGSAAGLAAVAIGPATSHQSGSYFGAAVAPAGDVNGDGRADALLGADDYDRGQVDEGAAFVILGR